MHRVFRNCLNRERGGKLLFIGGCLIFILILLFLVFIVNVGIFGLLMKGEKENDLRSKN